MDILKELEDIKKAIQDAFEDGKLTLREAIRIAREAADLLMIILPLLKSETGKAEAEIEVAG